MSLSLSGIQVDSSGLGASYVRANLVLGGTYPTGGDTLDMTQAAIACSCDEAPTDVWVDSIDGNGGYYVPIQGSSFNNWKLMAFAAGGSQLSAGAYPTDIVRINMIFNKLL